MKKSFRKLFICLSAALCLLFSGCATPANDVPRASRWHSGEHVPEVTLGEEGDYYLDFSTGSVYEKTAEGWTVRGELTVRQPEEQVTVTFDANGGTLPGERERVLGKGEGMALPVPERDGYRFLGWFYGEGANGGQANDLTAFTRDVLLTAKWRRLHVVTLVSSSAKTALGESFSFEGNYDGTDAATFSLYLEKEGVRHLADDRLSWISQHGLRFNVADGSILVAAEGEDEAEAELNVSVEEAA